MKRNALRMIMLAYQVITVCLLMAFVILGDYRQEIFFSWWIVTGLLILGLLIELIRLMRMRLKLQKMKDEVKK